jgi:hypothetical protein
MYGHTSMPRVAAYWHHVECVLSATTGLPRLELHSGRWVGCVDSASQTAGWKVVRSLGKGLPRSLPGQNRKFAFVIQVKWRQDVADGPCGVTVTSM